MEYTIPKFIEDKPKIVGPLTFHQFLYFAGAIAIDAALYFALPFFLFLPLAMIIFVFAVCLVFVKVQGHSVPDLVKNFFLFSSKSKVYLWEKKAGPYKIIKRKKIQKKPETDKEKKESSPIKIGGQSNLEQVVNRLDFGR
jgi:hypothetical protein